MLCVVPCTVNSHTLRQHTALGKDHGVGIGCKVDLEIGEMTFFGNKGNDLDAIETETLATLHFKDYVAILLDAGRHL